MTYRLIASRRHTLIVLALVVALSALGGRTGARVGARPFLPRPGLYLVLIALQWLWVRYVRVGLNAAGYRLGELTGPGWTLLRAIADVALAAAALLAARIAAAGVKAALGGPGAAVAFLLPHGVWESLLWVVLSCAAGLGEEIVFRGYLQRQFSALTGHVAAGILGQALVFGIAHAYQGRAAIATAGTYGLVFGLLAWWRGDVRAVALAHAATDIVGGLLPGRA